MRRLQAPFKPLRSLLDQVLARAVVPSLARHDASPCRSPLGLGALDVAELFVHRLPLAAGSSGAEPIRELSLEAFGRRHSQRAAPPVGKSRGAHGAL